MFDDEDEAFGVAGRRGHGPGRHHGGRHGHQGGPGGGSGFMGGPPGHGGPPPFWKLGMMGFHFGREFFGRPSRARRGDVRAALLALLRESPRNGYQLMQELEQRSHGVWRPSPGSVYPALQQLEDEGLVRSEASGTGKTYHLTDAGQRYAQDHEEELSSPWETIGHEEEHALRHDLMSSIAQIAIALKQVLHTGSPEQVDAAMRLMEHTRRDLYRILAGDRVDDKGSR